MIGLLVIGIFQAALLVLLLLTKRKKSTPDYILAGYLFLSALLIFLPGWKSGALTMTFRFCG